MMKNLFFGAIASLFIISCSQERLLNDTANEISSGSLLDLKRDTKLKTDFAKGFAVALKESKPLRDFIKSEAIKQINKDYDVIYHVVKNKKIISSDAKNSSLKLHDLLLQYFDEAQLLEIETQLPLLTIFVPELPEESFSAENWDTMTEIPLVAVRSYESNDVAIYDAEGKRYVLEAQYIPDFPVVVIKDNERIVSDRNIAQFNSLDTEVLTNPNDDVQLRLADNNFKANVTILNPGTTSSYPRVDPIHQQAYDVYKNYTPGGWQRDFIYYGLTPTNTEGGINPNYREYLTSFKLTGNPQSAYTKIASLQDPTLSNSAIPPNSSGWTDGSFEFGVYLSYGAKNSNLGLETKRFFSVPPTDLFEITYVKAPGFLGNFLNYKLAIITSTKMLDFYNNPNYKVEFPIWNLNNFSNQWQLRFEEVDTTTTHTNTISATNKYNANFSLEPSTGILKKVGLKFGASAEQTQTNTYVSQYTDISDNLGFQEIDFEENVVNMVNGQLMPRKYNTGFVEFEFRPRQSY